MPRDLSMPADMAMSSGDMATAACGGFFTVNTVTNAGGIPLVAGDWNRDNRGDLAYGFAAQLGNGDGTFAAQVALTGCPNGGTISDVATGDFNGDAKPDLLVGCAKQPGSYVSLLLGNGDGTFGAATVSLLQYLTPGDALDDVKLALGDFNGDGKLDVEANARSHQAQIVFSLLGDGSGGLTAGPPTTGGNASVNTLRGADFDGDGKLDLAIGTGVLLDVEVHFGRGDGSFGAATHYTPANDNYSLAVADFNGDARPDIAVPIGNAGALFGPLPVLSIFTNNGNGTFAGPANYLAATDQTFNCDDIVVADFNGDTHPDVAMACGLVQLWLNRGDGTFELATTCSGSSGRIVTADWNSDGKPDLAVTVTGGLEVLLNIH
jgi:hypothetical protein